jgi:hypothetical protein
MEVEILVKKLQALDEDAQMIMLKQQEPQSDEEQPDFIETDVLVLQQAVR